MTHEIAQSSCLSLQLLVPSLRRGMIHDKFSAQRQHKATKDVKGWTQQLPGLQTPAVPSFPTAQSVHHSPSDRALVPQSEGEVSRFQLLSAQIYHIQKPETPVALKIMFLALFSSQENITSTEPFTAVSTEC